MATCGVNNPGYRTLISALKRAYEGRSSGLRSSGCVNEPTANERGLSPLPFGERVRVRGHTLALTYERSPDGASNRFLRFDAQSGIDPRTSVSGITPYAR